jgi:hypothetical protein
MSILHNLLQKVNSTPVDSAELDKDIIAAFPTAFDGITKSIDAIVRPSDETSVSVNDQG